MGIYRSYAGGEYVRVNAKLFSESGYASLKDPLSGGTVTFGGTALIRLPANLELSGSIKGISLDIGNVSAKLVEIQTALNWSPVDVFFVSLGYRSLSIDAKRDREEADVTFSGPILTGCLKF